MQTTCAMPRSASGSTVTRQAPHVIMVAEGPKPVLSLVSYCILVNKHHKHALNAPWFPVPLRCPLSMLYVGLPKGPFGPLWNVDKPATFSHFGLFYWCVFGTPCSSKANECPILFLTALLIYIHLNIWYFLDGAGKGNCCWQTAWGAHFHHKRR